MAALTRHRPVLLGYAVLVGRSAMRLYHGSKSGISGPIRPMSCEHCDFGRGFYMGTDELQPLTLVCGYDAPHIYILELDLSGLSVLHLQPNLDWALFVAYNRGKLEGARGTSLYERCAHLADGKDVVAGKIANDRMFIVLDRFFDGLITDCALVECLGALNIGDQYVAKTAVACERVAIVDDRPIPTSEQEGYAELSEGNRRLGVSLAERICRERRREGRFFDEILEEGI